MSPTKFAASDAPKGKGGPTEVAPPAVGQFAMLNVTDASVEGKDEPATFSGFSELHRASMWLDGEIKKASLIGTTTQVIDLTPGLAEALLARNTSNRKLKDYMVENYARDIQHGRWEFNGEAIIVSRDGKLNDGQHRCAAVMKADKTILSVLVIGPTHDSRMTTDQGGTKTTGDYLSMDGHINANQLAAAAGFAIQWQSRNSIWSSGKPTKAHCRQFVNDNDSIIQSVAHVQQKGADAYGGRSTLAFCHWAFWQTASREAADKFIDSLINGAGLLARDPILYIRNRLINERGRLRGNDRVELLFRAWNAWRRQEQPRTLPILGGGLPDLEA